jgi:hypothetical protein
MEELTIGLLRETTFSHDSRRDDIKNNFNEHMLIHVIL